MSGLSQEHRTTTAAPTKSTTDNSTNTSVAESNSDRLDTLSAGDEGLTTMEDFKKLGASTRGGFTARAMQAAGLPGTPNDVLKSGKYKDIITSVEAAAVVSRVLNFGSNLEGGHLRREVEQHLLPRRGPERRRLHRGAPARRLAL